MNVVVFEVNNPFNNVSVILGIMLFLCGLVLTHVFISIFFFFFKNFYSDFQNLSLFL